MTEGLIVRVTLVNLGDLCDYLKAIFRRNLVDFFTLSQTNFAFVNQLMYVFLYFSLFVKITN